MSWYEEDFYNEPSEFDLTVEEFKEELMKSVKSEFLNTLDELNKENSELQKTKARLRDIEREHENKMRELETERRGLESQIRRERLSELVGDSEVELYTVAIRREPKPKCSKCDENRRIPFTTPRGFEREESCKCSEKISVYVPQPILLYSFSFRKGEANAWYKLENYDDSEYMTYHTDSISKKKLVTDDTEFEDVWLYSALFKTEELAQKYCDFKNKDVANEYL